MLLGCKVSLDDGSQLGSQILAVEPLFVEDRRDRVRLSVAGGEIPESVSLRQESLPLNDQAHRLSIALGGVRNPGGEEKNLKAETTLHFAHTYLCIFISVSVTFIIILSTVELVEAK